MNNPMRHFLFSTQLICLSLLLQSCAAWRDRRPASERDVILAETYNDIALGIEFVGTDSKKCQQQFSKTYDKLFNLAGESSYFDSSDNKILDQEIQSSFETRIILKDAFKSFQNKKAEDHQCLSSAQDVLRALRYIEDYLIELRMDKDNTAQSDFVTLKGEFPYFLVNPKYAQEFHSYEDLKSGDVLLSRGSAYTSAAIARIAEGDYQFSHLTFVLRNPSDQALYTTEAHIEIGSVTAPFQAHLDEKNTRTVVYRYKNQDIAHKASLAIFEKVRQHQLKGKNIEYDFSMNYKDDSRLYCSEVVSRGFKLAMPDEDFVPKFKSKFTSGMIPFLNTIGVPVSKENIDSLDVFAPGDIQMDPDFEMVAEWRNPKKLEESRYKDFILTKLFERMDKANYRFDGSLKMDIQSKTYWLLRRTPLVKKFIQDKFPLNMNPAMLEIFMILDKVGDSIYKEIELKSIDYDRAMTPKEIYNLIDDFIARDYEQYKKYKKGSDSTKPAFHLLFHP